MRRLIFMTTEGRRHAMLRMQIRLCETVEVAVKHMRSEGMSNVEIAKELKLPESTVHSIAKKYDKNEVK
jgi:DNA-binding NarL/FixJ family response regulator